MKLSPGERLLTLMLADIMEHLGTSGEMDASFIKKVVIDHDDWALSWKYSGVFHNEEPASEDEVLDTARIMAMMSFIEHSISQLPDEERSEFQSMRELQFRGFDGNHDRHHGIAMTMINDLNRFSEFQTRDLNSHGSATARGYLRMKPAYDDAMRGGMGNALSAEQLRTISEAYERG